MGFRAHERFAGLRNCVRDARNDFHGAAGAGHQWRLCRLQLSPDKAHAELDNKGELVRD
jgi:hypothetical protein